MHQSKRIAASSFLTAGLLALGSLGAVATAEDLTSHALEGAGIGAMCTAALAFAVVDAGVKQFDSEDGSSRMPLVILGVVGLAWGMIRVGLGDAWIIPGISGLLWMTMQAAFFTEPVEDEEEEPAA